MRSLKKLTLAKSIAVPAVLLCSLLILTMPAVARGRVGVGVVVGMGYPGWGGYPPYGPYYGGMYQNMGKIKLDTDLKDAEVYINGSYAGTTGKMKSFWLKPDAYDLEIRAPGRTQYAERIYVVAGKTLTIRPDLRVEDKQ